MRLALPSSPLVGTVVRRLRLDASSGAAVIAFALVALANPTVDAVGLGQVVEQSSLGQSLRVVVPVLLTEGDDVAGDCFRLAPSSAAPDGVPDVAHGRVSLEQTSSGARLVVTGPRPVNDPVLRLTLQAGCQTPIRREFVLFMDLPPVEAPTVALGDAIGRDAVDRKEGRNAVDREAPPHSAGPPPAPPATRSPAPRAPQGAARSAARARADVAKDARKGAPAKSRVAGKAAPAPKSAPMSVGSSQPRLKLSSVSLPASGGGSSGIGQARQAQSQQELADAIEAETVVLRQRIVELTSMVERMQRELQAGDAPQPAPQRMDAAQAAMAAMPVSAANAAPTMPPTSAASSAGSAVAATAPVEFADPQAAAPGASWWQANWPWLAAILLLPVLLAAALFWKRRRNDSRIDTWSTRLATTRPLQGVAPIATPTATLRNPPAGVALAAVELEISPPPPKKLPPAPIAKDSSKQLAVTELLHVTDESRVYVALGHPERAIEVLENHVKRVARPMPAARLMLLDLYHSTGQREEFRRTAEAFNVQCNVQAPQWETFGSNELDDGGIETFPHVLRRVVELWRMPECREYLDRLLHDNREGRRNGFPLAAYGDILTLIQVLDAPTDIDVDSDLADEGRPESDAQHLAAAAHARPPAAPRAQETTDSTPGETTIMRMSQQPLEFELDLEEATRPRDVEKTTRRGRKR